MQSCSSEEEVSDNDECESFITGNVSDDIKQRWEREQLELKQQWSPHDSQDVNLVLGSRTDDIFRSNYYIAGLDISYIKGDNQNACAALVVVQLHDLKVVYEDYKMVKINAPYIAGFLAFREVDCLIDMLDKLKNTNPEFYPHITMVDGNGFLHKRKFGLACHLGVLMDLATIGVAKNLYATDGITKDENHRLKINDLLLKSGDTFPLVGDSGTTYGYALRSSEDSTNPIYVSVGHKINLDSAVDVVYRCCKYRIPEPVRKADINSREFLRV